MSVKKASSVSYNSLVFKYIQHQLWIARLKQMSTRDTTHHAAGDDGGAIAAIVTDGIVFKDAVHHITQAYRFADITEFVVGLGRELTALLREGRGLHKTFEGETIFFQRLVCNPYVEELPAFHPDCLHVLHGPHEEAIALRNICWVLVCFFSPSSTRDMLLSRKPFSAHSLRPSLKQVPFLLEAILREALLPLNQFPASLTAKGLHDLLVLVLKPPPAEITNQTFRLHEADLNFPLSREPGAFPVFWKVPGEVTRCQRVHSVHHACAAFFTKEDYALHKVGCHLVLQKDSDAPLAARVGPVLNSVFAAPGMVSISSPHMRMHAFRMAQVLNTCQEQKSDETPSFPVTSEVVFYPKVWDQESSIWNAMAEDATNGIVCQQRWSLTTPGFLCLAFSRNRTTHRAAFSIFHDTFEDQTSGERRFRSPFQLLPILYLPAVEAADIWPLG